MAPGKRTASGGITFLDRFLGKKVQIRETGSCRPITAFLVDTNAYELLLEERGGQIPVPILVYKHAVAEIREVR
jgi:hypothetical protein